MGKTKVITYASRMVFASQTTSSKCLTTVFPFILTAVLSSLFSVAHCMVPALLKLRPYGAIQIILLLLFFFNFKFFLIIIIIIIIITKPQAGKLG